MHAVPPALAPAAAQLSLLVLAAWLNSLVPAACLIRCHRWAASWQTCQTATRPPCAACCRSCCLCPHGVLPLALCPREVLPLALCPREVLPLALCPREVLPLALCPREVPCLCPREVLPLALPLDQATAAAAGAAWEQKRMGWLALWRRPQRQRCRPCASCCPGCCRCGWVWV